MNSKSEATTSMHFCRDNELSISTTKYKKYKPIYIYMIKYLDNCLFYSNPNGKVYTCYVSIDDSYGFISCSKSQK